MAGTPQGYPPQQGYSPQQPYGQQQPYNTDPNAGKIPGIVIAGFILSFLCSLIGLILCAIGLNEAKRRGAGVGLAYAGIIISIVFIILSVGINIDVRA